MYFACEACFIQIRNEYKYALPSNTCIFSAIISSFMIEPGDKRYKITGILRSMYNKIDIEQCYSTGVDRV